ncbi:phage minor capsid protein [Nonomuraea spiralis]|uniref:Phage minor capsid protein n=1 Tax=Nonomuraea spiralis TaxID=46182 RepID=A0ABV5J061_9ACTN|nr:phage minor capsid protein [Nonomuraea spiralis]GGS88437.1 hypothetical protein GCM10010176_035260 [Nonomuraea spiralis]
MAVDQDLLDQIAGSVADLYREVETALVRAVAQRLRADLPLPSPFEEGKLAAVRQLQAAAQAILLRLQKARVQVIRQALADAYRTGQQAALVGVTKAVAGRARAAEQVIPNARLMENLAMALHRDVGRVDANILRAPVDAYRAVQAGAAARITSGAFTRREASQAAWQRLMDRGIVDFTDRAGRRWKLSSYVEMLARSNAQRAAVQGQTDRLQDLGIDLVYISDNVQECKRCRPFESKVLARGSGPVGKVKVEHATRDGEMVTVDVIDTLQGAMAKGLFHPNCRHSASAYLPGVTKLRKNTADPDGDKARQKQRALERRIRAEKEKALGALTPEAKKDAGARVRAAQAALRAHLAAHPKLKRLPYREQIGAGNIPRAGGPKGGPVGDLEPPKDNGPTLDRGAELETSAERQAVEEKPKQKTAAKTGRKVGVDARNAVLREGDPVTVAGKPGRVIGKGKHGAIKVEVAGQQQDVSPVDVRSTRDADTSGQANAATQAGAAKQADTTSRVKELETRYGGRLRIQHRSQLGAKHAADFARIPDAFHDLLAKHVRFVDFGDGAVPDFKPELRGVQPRGWPAGKTWDDVPAAYDPSTRHIIVAGGRGLGHGSASVAAHETGHAVDDALGHASSSPEFGAVHADAVSRGVLPYFAQAGAAGREEMFAEAFAAWVMHRDDPRTARDAAVGQAVGVPPAVAAEIGGRLSEYFSNLLLRLER